MRNSALRVVISPSVQSEPEMGEGPVKKSEEVLLFVCDCLGGSSRLAKAKKPS